MKVYRLEIYPQKGTAKWNRLSLGWVGLPIKGKKCFRIGKSMPWVPVGKYLNKWIFSQSHSAGKITAALRSIPMGSESPFPFKF